MEITMVLSKEDIRVTKNCMGNIVSKDVPSIYEWKVIPKPAAQTIYDIFQITFQYWVFFFFSLDKIFYPQFRKLKILNTERFSISHLVGKVWSELTWCVFMYVTLCEYLHVCCRNTTVFDYYVLLRALRVCFNIQHVNWIRFLKSENSEF